MITRLNAVFTQLTTDTQHHHQTQSHMAQIVHPSPSSPSQKKNRPNSRRKHRRRRSRKCYRCRLYGHLAVNCEAPFPRQNYPKSQHTGNTTAKPIKKEPDSPQNAFPQNIPKTTIKQDDQDYISSTKKGIMSVVSCGPVILVLKPFTMFIC